MKGGYPTNKRWREKCPQEWYKSKNRNYEKGREYKREVRAKWTRRECKIILESTLTDREIAKKLRRTVRSIQVKRSRLKKEQHQR